MNFRRSIIIAELWQPEVARHGKVLNFAFFRKTTPYGIASPIDVLCSNFVKFGRREIGTVVRYLPDKKKLSPRSPALATAQIAPKICQDQPLTMYSEFSRFHRNRFTFGEVIAERVTTVKTGRKVNPIFG